MASTYKFHVVPISAITIEDRQRKTFDEAAQQALTDSIYRHGLLNPITINKSGVLIAGERRLRSAIALGWTEIPAHFIEELDAFERRVIELEENIQRANLTWQEEVFAFYDYHNARCEGDPDWGIQETADALNSGTKTVRDKISVAKALREGDEAVKLCQTFTAALNVLSRKYQRGLDNEMALVSEVLQKTDPHEDRGSLKDGDQPQESSRPSSSSPSMIIRPASEDIVVGDFRTFASTWEGPTFNLLHIDFPYGIGMDNAKQGEIKSHGTYDDSEELFWELMTALLSNKDRIVAPNAHILFWFPMKNYAAIKDTFESEGFIVNPVPLIWYKTDNVGILPDPKRGPRQIYESCLLIRRGDRYIVRPTVNVCAQAAMKAKAKHLSEKPYLVVNQFLSMLVDESTIFLDPTCGCGNAITAAEFLGARFVKGLDVNPVHVETARAQLNSHRITVKTRTQRTVTESVLDDLAF